MMSFYRCYDWKRYPCATFNIFGPRQDPSSPYSGVLAKFITQMLNGNSLQFSAMANRAGISPISRMRSKPTCWPAKLPRTKWPASIQRRDGRRVTLNETFKLLQTLTSFLRLHSLWRGTQRRHQAFPGRHFWGGTASRLQTEGGFRGRPAANRRLVSQPGRRSRSIDGDPAPEVSCITLVIYVRILGE